MIPPSFEKPVPRINRRELFAAVSALAIGAHLHAKGCDDSPRLGLCVRKWGASLELAELLDLLGSVRITGVELGVGGAHGIDIELGPEQRELARRTIEESDVKLVGLRSGLTLGLPQAEGDLMGRARAWIELTADLGAGGVELVVAPPLEGDRREDWIARSVELLRPLAELAGEASIELRLRAGGAPEPLRMLLDALDEGACVGTAVLGPHGSRALDVLRGRLGAVVRSDELDEARAEALETAGFDGWWLIDPRDDEPADPRAALEGQRATFDALFAD